MSDYVKAKVIRLLFPQALIKKLGVDEEWECEDYLKETYGELWNRHKNDTWIEIEYTTKACYLDYVLEYEYGADCGDYGYVFLLNNNDRKKYTPIFDKLGVSYDVNDLRKVVYCYYNCSECQDYYDVNEITFESL